jgi:hypothetical protein
MTLGCGGYGGNITSDNISPRHLLNIKRLAYEVTPAARASSRPAAQPTAQPAAMGVSAEALARRVDAFLGSRGFGQGSRDVGPAKTDPLEPNAPNQAPLEFVCEEDVRLALRAGRKLLVAERAIVTPAARELGEEHRVFSVAPSRV